MPKFIALKLAVVCCLFIVQSTASAFEVLIFEKRWEVPGECYLSMPGEKSGIKDSLECTSDQIEINIYQDGVCYDEYYHNAVDSSGESITFDETEKGVRYTELSLLDKNSGDFGIIRIVKNKEYCIIAISMSRTHMESSLKGIWLGSPGI